MWRARSPMARPTLVFSGRVPGHAPLLCYGVFRMNFIHTAARCLILSVLFGGNLLCHWTCIVARLNTNTHSGVYISSVQYATAPRFNFENSCRRRVSKKNFSVVK